jgi:DNA-binding HxlR family transcriptional regulator
LKRSDCPLSCALDLIGDKWSLLIVRDLLFGLSRYSELAAAGEGSRQTSWRNASSNWSKGHH